LEVRSQSPPIVAHRPPPILRVRHDNNSRKTLSHPFSGFCIRTISPMFPQIVKGAWSRGDFDLTANNAKDALALLAESGRDVTPEFGFASRTITGYAGAVVRAGEHVVIQEDCLTSIPGN